MRSAPLLTPSLVQAKDAHVGAVKAYSLPPKPQPPALPTDLASELAAYDAAEPTKAETKVAAEPVVEGKNEAERKANLRLKLAEKYAELHGAELGAAQARRDVEVARIQLDGLRYQLRLLEVRQGGRA